MASPYTGHGKAEEREREADAKVDPEVYVVQINARVYEVSPLGAQAVKHLCHATHFKTSNEAHEAIKFCGYSDGTYHIVQAKDLRVMKRAAKRKTE